MADNSWGKYLWGDGTWGGNAADVTVYVGVEEGWGRSTFGFSGWNSDAPDQDLLLTINAPQSQPWGFDAWGADEWGGAVDPVIVKASANVVLSSAQLGISTGTLTFSGIANVTATGNQLTLTLNNATVRASANANASTNLWIGRAHV